MFSRPRQKRERDDAGRSLLFLPVELAGVRQTWSCCQRWRLAGGPRQLLVHVLGIQITCRLVPDPYSAISVVQVLSIQISCRSVSDPYSAISVVQVLNIQIAYRSVPDPYSAISVVSPHSSRMIGMFYI
uniref:Uncharacterized protein n=1 Tax=Solanum tuberosum TaxID=4113 RepID=M1DLL7_SOLTU